MSGAQKLACAMFLWNLGCIHPTQAPMTGQQQIVNMPAKISEVQLVKIPTLEVPAVEPTQVAEAPPEEVPPAASPEEVSPITAAEIKTVIPENPKVEELTNGLVDLVWRIHRGIWWECGKKYQTKEAVKIAAREWSAAIVSAHENTSYKLRSGQKINPSIREAVGIITNESHFDRCAIGVYTRLYAYKTGLLVRPKTNISHTIEEVQALLNSPKCEGRLVDLGPGQIVKRLGKKHTSWDTAQTYLTVVPGIQHVFDELAYRGRIYNTKYPSLFWPGSKKNMWYLNRILQLTIPVLGPYKLPKKV